MGRALEEVSLEDRREGMEGGEEEREGEKEEERSKGREGEGTQ